MKHARPATRALAIALLALQTLVLAACASTESHKSTGEFIDDAAITTRVKAAFARSDEVDATDIEVDTHKGVVQLSGFADSDRQIDRAVEIARGIDGVREVENDIRLKSGSG